MVPISVNLDRENKIVQYNFVSNISHCKQIEHLWEAQDIGIYQ